MKKFFLLVGLFIFLSLDAFSYSKTIQEYKQLGSPVNDLFNKPMTDYFYSCYRKPNLFNNLRDFVGTLNELTGGVGSGGSCGPFMGPQYKLLVKELKRITGYKNITIEIYRKLENMSRRSTLQSFLNSLNGGRYIDIKSEPEKTTTQVAQSDEIKKEKQSDTTKVVKLEPQKNETKKQITQTVAVQNDTTGPDIIVKKTFEANQNLTAIIKGSITDDSEIVLVSVDGVLVSLNKGRFSSPIYVQPKGQTIEIIAMDKRGNKTRTEVNVKRSAVVIATKKFDFLDPRKIKAKLKPNSVALIIGVEDYKKVVSATFAVNDALNFNDFVHSSLGVPKYHIKLLLNEDAARNNTLDVLATWLPKVIKENKTDLYVFFSGHGLASEDGGDLFLLPSDGVPEILKVTALLRNSIFKNISKLNPKSVTVFLDTCYSGATRSEEFLVAARPIFIEVAEQEIPSNFTVFSAAAGRETAKVLPEAEHGLFSYYLMKGLEGEADVNSDNQITNGELHAFINKNVSRQANQTPQLSGNPDQVLVQW